MSRQRTRKLWQPWILAVVLTGLYALAVVLMQGDSLALVTVGEQYAPDSLLDRAYSEEGYDGQFVYYLARYGFDAAPYLDVPAYRAQRILLPVAGAVLSLNQAAVLPWTLLLVNLVAVGAGTYLLSDLLKQAGVSAWFSVGYGLSAGVLGAARLMTTEPLAYALAIAGWWLWRRDRWLWSALLIALAGLTKETAFLVGGAIGLEMLLSRQPLRAVRFGVIALLPFGLWQMVLYGQFGSVGIGSGGALATSFEVIPFMGFIRILTEGSAEAFILLLPIVGLFVLVPTMWALWQCGRDAIYSWRVRRDEVPVSERRGWNLHTTLLLSQAVIMAFVPFSTYREPLGILRFIVGLQFALILYAAHRRQRRALTYSTLWFLTSLLVVMSDVGA